MTAPAEPLQVGDPGRVGRYRILGRLGAGGMGRVYLGETPDGERVAIKVVRDELADDTAFRSRFRREVAAASAVVGMFTARVLDADPDADPPWLATQYVEGPTLRAAVDRDGPLPEAVVLDVARGLAEALAAIHAAGLVHRDLKPANVLLSPAGPRVIDFGIARAVDASRLTGTGQVVGTPGFMAPEQVEAHAPGPAGDIFALGSTLVFAATGRGPFDADTTAATVYRILHQPPDLRFTPPRVASLAAACLAKDPAARPTAVRLAVELRGGGPPSRQAEPPLPPITGPRRRGLVIGGVAAAALLAGGVGVAVYATAGGPAAAVAATTAPAPPTATSTIDPASPQARYVDRLCSSGALLTSLGETATVPPATGDPAQAKRDYLAGVDRTIGTVDAALADLTVLRDDAPTPQVRTQFGLVVDQFTKARAELVAGRAQVAAAEPLTIDAYRGGVEHYTNAAADLALAASLVRQITLPPDYTAASAVAPHCTQR